MTMRPSAQVVTLAVVAVSIVATFALPWPLAGWTTGHRYADPVALGSALARGLVGGWTGGRPVGDPPGPGLDEAVAFWRAFHAYKAVFAAFTLAGLVWWSRAVRRPASSVFAAVTGVGALVVVVANAQGTWAPFASALDLTRDAVPTPGFTEVLTGLRSDLLTGAAHPLTTAVLEDSTRYHQVMAVLSIAVAASALVLFARSVRPKPRMLVLLGTAAVAAAFGILAAANLSTSVDPTPALASFLSGLH